ncbi:MAG: hypothetical protein JKX73_11405 [Flavobacteriales bacterium]|nr:hypothetical protein [Flavobacteriales bacterium]
MKYLRSLFILFILLTLSVRTVWAQRGVSDSLMNRASMEYPLEYTGVFKTNPLSMLWGSIPLTAEFVALYEFVSAPQQSSQVGISYISKSPILKVFEDTIQDLKLLTINGVRLQLSHRLYFLSQYDFAPRGLYFAPQISYATVKVSTKHYSSRDVYIRVTQFNANMLIGWQWINGGDYTIDVFTGLGYKDNIWEGHDSQTTIRIDNDEFGGYYSSNFKFSIGFHLGIAF